MTHPYNLLPLEPNKPAGLIFTPCPGTKGTSVDDALTTLQQAGATALITLMPQAELEAHQAATLAEHCAAKGLWWFHCPIADDEAPAADFTKAWQQAGAQVHQLLSAGKTVAIHCKGGSGRTGLIAAQILLERGEAQDVVQHKVQALRPYALTLPAHVDYFQQVAETQS